MIHSVKIKKIVYGGEGLGRLADGRAVFVPFVLPGEEVQIELTEEKARFARGIANIWLQNSPDRIPAHCPHFGICGGCHFQHMAYEQQLKTKLETLRDQLSRIGGIDPNKITDITPSPQHWAYRNQIQLQLNETGEMGFVRADFQGILPLDQCPIAMSGLNELLSSLAFEPGCGLTRISLREDSFGERFILLEGEDDLPPEMTIELDASLGYLNSHQNYYHLAGNDQLHFQVLGKELSLSPESFFQVNNEMANLLVSHVLKLVEQNKPGIVWELYSGAGLFSVFLAEKVKQLIAIESAPSACYDFANNLDAFDHVSLYEGAVELVLPELIKNLQAEAPGAPGIITTTSLPEHQAEPQGPIPSDFASPDLISKDIVPPELVSSNLISLNPVPSDSASPDLVSSNLISPNPIPSDFASPDLVSSNLISPNPVPSDFASPDLVSSNLISPNPVPSDFASPDLISKDMVPPELVSSDPVLPDLVLLDPPRAGLHPKALDALVELAPANIIYVSCDPSTLARDLKRLTQQGYEVQSIHAFDMFPQTYHVETCAYLSKQDVDDHFKWQ